MPDREDGDALREKYLHSMGAALTDEGDLEEAVVFFQKALDVRETPYAWYGLARALHAADDTAGAVGAMSRAIKLAPDTAEYHHERAALLKALGRPDLADEDLRKAISLDRNFERIDEIRQAARIVEEAFGSAAPEGGDEGAEVRSPELRRILKEARVDIFHKASCPVHPCPAYCCHFIGRLLLHGVTISPWKLQGLRRHFRQKGLREEDFLEIFPVAEAEHGESLFPPQDIVKPGGIPSVVFPRQKMASLGEDIARDVPKTKDYRTVMWTGKDAKPCVFLTAGRCSVYDVGDEASLEACASFLCMTGFVFVVLRSLGLPGREAMDTKSMGELNDTAIDALIILSRDVYGSDEATASSEEMSRYLRTAIGEDLAGNDSARDAALRQYNLLKIQYDKLIDTLLPPARRKITQLFSGQTS